MTGKIVADLVAAARADRHRAVQSGGLPDRRAALPEATRNFAHTIVLQHGSGSTDRRAGERQRCRHLIVANSMITPPRTAPSANDPDRHPPNRISIIAGDRSNSHGAIRDFGILEEDAEIYIAAVRRARRSSPSMRRCRAGSGRGDHRTTRADRYSGAGYSIACDAAPTRREGG